jgi:hypothetical protein
MVVSNKYIKQPFEVNIRIVFSSRASEKKQALGGAFGQLRSL